MKEFDKKTELYFELRGTPDSSRDSYGRRIHGNTGTDLMFP